MKKKQKNQVEDLDIESALSNKIKFVTSEKDEEVYTKEKALSPFDFVKDIRKFKTNELLDKEENKKSWNTFMILRALSMNNNDVEIVNVVNQYQNLLTPEAIYFLLQELIPQNNNFYHYISTKAKDYNDVVTYISKYYEIPKKQAQEYLTLMGKRWANKIQSMYECRVVGRIKK